MRNIKLTVAYDGTAYHGFQRQANALTIQEVLETALAPLFAQPLSLAGSGRTDAGVHACGQVVSFFAGGGIPVNRIPAASKALLPGDIVVIGAEEVDREFHARFSAKSKIYVYRILRSSVADPFLRNYAWRVATDLNIAAMQTAMACLVGEHDFSAFRAAGGPPVNPVRTMLEAACFVTGNMIELRFWGNGFLYHMVRNLAGTLVDVGKGKVTAAGFAQILAGKDRAKAGITAPPQGLYLQEVKYQ